MKRYLMCAGLFLLVCSFSYADQALDETGTLRKFGALYQNPRAIPWLIECPPAAANPSSRQYVNHRANMPPVGNQGSQGSCVAWANAYYYKSYQEWLEHGWTYADAHHRFSPAFMYNLINGGVDGGSYASDAMLVLLNHGCANLAEMPYNQGNCTIWPSDSAYYNAMPYRCDAGYWIDVSSDLGIATLKQHLETSDNAVLYIYCWDNFLYIGNFHNTYCVSDVYGSNHGGHGVCIVGYDDTLTTSDGTGAFIVANSWGTGWGDQGYFWMSYQAVKSSVTSQLWVNYLADKINYSPTLEVRFRPTHTKREYVYFTVQTSSYNNQFFHFYIVPGAAHSFPPNNIVLDITEAAGNFTPNDKNFIYFSAYDRLSDGVTGTIDYYASLNDEWGVYSRSSQTPMSIPDYGAVTLTLWHPTQKLHWQMFHHVPAHTGVTTLDGDIDTVYAYWLYGAGRPVYSSPVLGDVDNDNKIEVVVGSNDSSVYALNGENGSQRWFYHAGGAIAAAPCLGEIDQDTLLEVVAGSLDGKIYALNGENGSFLWSYTAAGSIRSSPCLSDVDGDGLLEIVFGSDDNSIYALNGENGSLRWSRATGGDVVSSPACADINIDGVNEIVAGSSDNRIYALNGKTGDTLWTRATSGSVVSSPCIADVDLDTFPEIIFGSADGYVYALNGEDGSLRWLYHTGAGISSSPCAGDIDGDNLPEVAVGCSDHSVYALNGGNGSLLWSRPLGDSVVSSPCLGDIDGDNQPEVIIGSKDHYVYALNGGDGSVLWSYQTGGAVSSSPCLGDIDNDNLVEIVVGSGDGIIYALSGDPTGTAESGRKGTMALDTGSCLFPNRPNPFSTSTVISYTISNDSRVRLVLFDITGKRIATLVDEQKKSGRYQHYLYRRSLSGNSLSDGVYFICLEAGNKTQAQKMVVITGR
ncbi:MAG TPA: PQQ-binding-like beta-propeller repeat protein [bacterium]